MGFLKDGTPMPWRDALVHLQYVRDHGVEQFLNVFHEVKDRKNDVLLWGDEVEFHLVKLFDARAALYLGAPRLLKRLEGEDEAQEFTIKSAWRPEYGRWMVEATPGEPYGGFTHDLIRVEANMTMRRLRIQRLLPTGVVPLSTVAFPTMGVGSFTEPPLPPGGKFARSSYLPDDVISPHPRFGTLTANIRTRRGERVCILAPVLQDRSTAAAPAARCPNEHRSALEAFRSRGAAAVTRELAEMSLLDQAEAAELGQRMASAEAGEAPGAEAGERASGDEGAGRAGCCEQAQRVEVEEAEGPAALCPSPPPSLTPGYVHMDAMGFGMGLCCLQVTFQARDLDESRALYDQLVVVAPYVLALTANTSIAKGRLLDTDTRWDIISDSVDCRTPAERGVAGLNQGCGTSATAVGAVAHQHVRTAIEFAERQRAARAAAPDAAAPAAPDAAAPAAPDAAAPAAPEAAAPRPGHLGPTGEPPMCCGPPGPALPAWQREALPGADRSATESGRVLPKSRYSSVDCYLSSSRRCAEKYNDIPVECDPAIVARLRSGGVDPQLARHVAHLFNRDPLVVFSGQVEEVDDEKSTEHFENFQSTNWQSVRWKPPGLGGGMGWRVELRTMETGATDFENAAFTIFAVLLTRVLLAFDLDLYLPISLVEANFFAARQRNAASEGLFYFRRKVAPLPPTEHHAPCGSNGNGEDAGDNSSGDGEDNGAAAAEGEEAAAAPAAAGGCPEAAAAEAVAAEGEEAGVPTGVGEGGCYELLSLREILLGPEVPAGHDPDDDEFPGLIALMRTYLKVIGCDPMTMRRVDVYLGLVAQRAMGDVVTPAEYQRQFVRRHPEYKGDSVVSDKIAADLIRHLDDVSEGRVAAPQLLGEEGSQWVLGGQARSQAAAALASAASAGQKRPTGPVDTETGAAASPRRRRRLRGQSWAESLFEDRSENNRMLRELVKQYKLSHASPARGRRAAEAGAAAGGEQEA